MSNPLETYLDGLHMAYRAQGRARLFKVPTPGEPRRAGGKLLYRRDKARWLDFTGLCLKTGMSLNVEAKLCVSASYKTSFPLGRLEDVQVSVFADLAEADKGIGALFVRHAPNASSLLDYNTHAQRLVVGDYLIPCVWRDGHLAFVGQREGRKSIRWQDIQHLKVPPRCTWLDAVIPACGAFWVWEAYKRAGWPEVGRGQVGPAARYVGR